MQNDKQCVVILTKVYKHVAAAIGKKLNEIIPVSVFCYDPDRLNYLGLEADFAINNDFDFDFARGKEIILLALDQNCWASLEAGIEQLSLMNFKVRGILCCLDIPEESFSANNAFDYDFSEVWDKIFDKGKDWEIAIVGRKKTADSLMKYLNKKPVFTFQWPKTFLTPKKKIFDKYAIYCAGIVPQKGQLGLIEAFASIPNDISLYLVGDNMISREYVEQCTECAKLNNVNVKLLPFITEQEKYDLIGSSLFTVCGENYEDCGSSSPIEGFYLGKVACVWDNRTNRDFYEDYALYAKTKEEFVANMMLAIDMTTDYEDYRNFAVRKFGIDQFVDSFTKGVGIQ